MTFFESIQTVFRKYAEFSGRATRPEYWWFALFSALVSSALNSLNVYTTHGTGTMFAMAATSSSLLIGSSLSGLWSIAVLLPSLAVTVRRLRDAGREWVELFWVLLPIVGWIILIVHLAEPTKTTAVTSPAPAPAPQAPTPAPPTQPAAAPTTASAAAPASASATQKPAPRKPAAQKPAAQKPTTTKPAATKPAPKKPTPPAA